MTVNEFKSYIKCWLAENANDDELFKTNYYIESRIKESSCDESDGEFYYEDEILALGKFYHRIVLESEDSKNGVIKTINYLALGIGYKDKSGELIDYEELDFMII